MIGSSCELRAAAASPLNSGLLPASRRARCLPYCLCVSFLPFHRLGPTRLIDWNFCCARWVCAADTSLASAEKGFSIHRVGNSQTDGPAQLRGWEQAAARGVSPCCCLQSTIYLLLLAGLRGTTCSKLPCRGETSSGNGKIPLLAQLECSVREQFAGGHF